jgi:type III pantothenate kinase
MIILLDAGNSRFKWTRLRSGSLSDVSSQEYGFQDRAQAVLTSLEMSEPGRIVVSSVLGGEFKEKFTRLAKARFGLNPEFVVPTKSGYGVRLAYDDPTVFGADRFSALVAARHKFDQACVVVDCGTAVTIDALTADGQHLGGLIFPGLELMRHSLLEHTARIDVGLENNGGLFGRSTSHGVRGGTLRALVGGIDQVVQGMTAHITEQFGESHVKYLMTGGTGAYVISHLAADYHLEPWLVLQGLASIAEVKPL